MSKRIAYLVIVSGLVLSSCSSNSEDGLPEPIATKVQQKEEPRGNSEADGADVSTSPSKKPKPESNSESTAQTKQPGSYLTFEDYEASKERFADADVVLFFNANWCSTCKIARDNIESNLESIPSNLAIVVVDFDNETYLRKKYGVTIQHTFVQIDKDGNLLAKWAGSTTAEEIAENTV
jgi:thiol-disulfide isomerase/thioredoxin